MRSFISHFRWDLSRSWKRIMERNHGSIRKIRDLSSLLGVFWETSIFWWLLLSLSLCWFPVERRGGLRPLCWDRRSVIWTATALLLSFRVKSGFPSRCFRWSSSVREKIMISSIYTRTNFHKYFSRTFSIRCWKNSEIFPCPKLETVSHFRWEIFIFEMWSSRSLFFISSSFISSRKVLALSCSAHSSSEPPLAKKNNS